MMMRGTALHCFWVLLNVNNSTDLEFSFVNSTARGSIFESTFPVQRLSRHLYTTYSQLGTGRRGSGPKIQSI